MENVTFGAFRWFSGVIFRGLFRGPFFGRPWAPSRGLCLGFLGLPLGFQGLSLGTLGFCLGFFWALWGPALGFWGPFGGVSEVGRTPVAPMWALLAGPWLAWASHAWASQAYGEKNVMLTDLSWRYCPGGRGRTDGRINPWHENWTSDLRIWGSWSLGHLSTFGSGLSYEV